MTDKELLELAAKAAGIKGEYYSGILNDVWVEGILYIRDDGQQMVWNPLTDDGDALRLAVKLEIFISWFGREVVANEDWDDPLSKSIQRSGPQVLETKEPDKYVATRRAIVRAAAEVALKSGEGTLG